LIRAAGLVLVMVTSPVNSPVVAMLLRYCVRALKKLVLKRALTSNSIVDSGVLMLGAFHPVPQKTSSICTSVNTRPLIDDVLADRAAKKQGGREAVFQKLAPWAVRFARAPGGLAERHEHKRRDSTHEVTPCE